MTSPKPPDFEPLASSDPVSGDTDAIAALGKRYTDTAAEIAQQASNLRKLAASAPDGWKGQAGTVFASKATDLASRITAAEQRYTAAGKALTACAGPMYEAQQRAYAAVWQAKAAQQQMSANQPGPPRPPGSPPLTAEQKAAEQTRKGNYDSARGSLSAARTAFDNAVQDYHNSAARAASQVNAELSHDSLTDSWWDRNFGWISKVFTVVAIAVIVLAVIALVIACPLSAGLLVALGASADTLALAGTIIGWLAFGLTALQAVYDGVAAGTGKESWTAFALDIVALATFGLGKGAEAIGEGLADGGESVAKTVAASRAGGEVMSSNNLPRITYTLAKNSSLVRLGLRVIGKASAFSDADDAAKSAVATVEDAVKAAKPSAAVAVATMSNELAGSLAKLDAANDVVPGVLRIAARLRMLQGIAGMDGALQWGSFVGGGGFTIYGIATGG